MGSAHSAPAPSRVRTLHPGWYASVMGTAVLAVVTSGNPGGLDVTKTLSEAVAVVFLVVATGLAIGFGVMYSQRWISHRDSAMTDLGHPVAGPLIGTVPGGLLVLAAAYVAAGPILLPDAVATGIATALVIVGAPLAVVVGVAWAAEVVANAPLGLEKVTGTWFLPPVITVLVPLAGAPLVVDWSAPEFWLWLGYALLGTGMLLFVVVTTLVVMRLGLHGPPPPPMAPAVWIAVGPPGAGSLAMLRLSQATDAIGMPGADGLMAVTVVVATGLGGFGLWWLAFAAAVLRRQLKAGPIPYTPAWWAWTFPLGALTALTVTLGTVWDSTAVTVLGVVLLLATIGVWVLVSLRTAREIGAGTAWARHG